MILAATLKLARRNDMSKQESESLEGLFYPKNIAIVGASPKITGRGNRWVIGLIKLNFKGKIFPVNPTADTIMGLQAYPSIRDIPFDVDLVTFAIPFQSVLQVMEDCVAKGVKYVHLFTAGFSETGDEETTQIEKQLIETAREGGIRLVGPNCMGLYCPESGLTWAEDFPKKPGPVGFVSQSGQLAYQFITDGAMDNLRFSKVVSFGNASDLGPHDFLNYLADDDKTEIICSYIEGLKNGRAIFDFARNTAGKKPIVIWKGGQTEGGARATQSHTASIAGSADIWQAVCRQTGIISVNNLDELVATTSALHRMKELPKGVGVAILGGAGGGSVTMTDMAEKEGLKVPSLSDRSVDTLKEFVPMSGTSVNNPLDIGFSRVFSDEKLFLKLFSLLGDDPNIDAMIFSLSMMRGGVKLKRSQVDAMMQMILKGIEIIGKPVFLVLQGGKTLELLSLRDEMQDRYNEAGLATFPSFTLAAKTLYRLNQYQRFLDRNLV